MCYRALVHIPEEDPIDIFQKVLLGLAAAGVRSSAEMAKLTNLGEDLVELVTARLHDDLLLDSQGTPTSAGKAILNGNTPTRTKTELLHVFFDLEKGRFWPRVAPRLVRVETFARGGATYVVLGTQGAPMDERIVYAHRSASNSTPRADHQQDILKSVRQHRRDRNVWKNQEQDPNLVSLQTESVGEPPTSAGKVLLFQDDGRLVYLTTWLTADPFESNAEEAWTALDPFGLGESAFLRTRIREQRREGTVLARAISEFTAAIGADERELDNIDFDEAQQKVLRRVGSPLPINLMNRLVAIQKEFHRIERDFLQGDKDQTRSTLDANSLAVKLGVALEHMLGQIAHVFPHEGVADAVPENESYRSKWFLGLVRHIGFTQEDVRLFARQTPGALRNAIHENRRSLVQHLSIALLSARVHPEHPFYQLAKRSPESLGNMIRVMKLRNIGAHDNDKSIDYADLKRSVDVVFDFAQEMISAKPETNLR